MYLLVSLSFPSVETEIIILFSKTIAAFKLFLQGIIPYCVVEI
jgi:hypothetical protein